jgi:hypothetical protein
MLANLTITQLTYLMAIVSGVVLVVFGIGLWAGYWMGRNSAGMPVVAYENKRKPTAADAPYRESVWDDEYEQALHGVDAEGNSVQ